MSEIGSWWGDPRKITILVDNESWIVPYAQQLKDRINTGRDQAVLCRTYDEIVHGDIAFYLGCIRITPPAILKLHKCNLVVHESDLPAGRGFAPLAWQILAGASAVPICLIEAIDEADAGRIYMKDMMYFEGHELNNEIREVQGLKTIDLCMKFLESRLPPEGETQRGQPTVYKRRTPDNSRLDVNVSIRDQFDLLRIVDNDNYPAFFDYRGHRYRLKIEQYE